VDGSTLPGLQWINVGSDPPKSGSEVHNGALAAALKHTVEFSKDDLRNFELPKLPYGCFIKVGEEYFVSGGGSKRNLDHVEKRSMRTRFLSKLQDFDREKRVHNSAKPSLRPTPRRPCNRVLQSFAAPP